MQLREPGDYLRFIKVHLKREVQICSPTDMYPTQPTHYMDRVEKYAKNMSFFA